MSRTLWKRSREITILHQALSWSTAVKSIELQLFYFHFHPLPLTCFLLFYFKLTCSSLALRWHSKLATATHRRPHASWLWPACGYTRIAFAAWISLYLLYPLFLAYIRPPGREVCIDSGLLVQGSPLITLRRLLMLFLQLRTFLKYGSRLNLNIESIKTK